MPPRYLTLPSSPTSSFHIPTQPHTLPHRLELGEHQTQQPSNETHANRRRDQRSRTSRFRAPTLRSRSIAMVIMVIRVHDLDAANSSGIRALVVFEERRRRIERNIGALSQKERGKS